MSRILTGVRELTESQGKILLGKTGLYIFDFVFGATLVFVTTIRA